MKTEHLQRLERTLLMVKDIFDEIGEEFFLARGTLLGYIREGGFIKWDDDIDVGSFADVSKKEIRDKLINKCIEKGFRCNINNDSIEWGFDIIAKSYVPVGIKFWRECNGFIRETNSRIRYKIDYIKDLKKINFLDTEFLIPNKPKSLLRLWYGDWNKIGRKAWCLGEGEDMVLHEDQKTAYRDGKAQQYYVETNKDGEFIYPLNALKITEKKKTWEDMYKTGITFGAFDFFHKGHMNLLDACNYRCEKLIICVSDDEYIKKHKGHEPMFNLGRRQYTVSNYANIVDMQTETFTKKDAIEKYKPDVIFVGNDWNRDTFSGEGLGVPVIYLPYTKGISSTKLRERYER